MTIVEFDDTTGDTDEPLDDSRDYSKVVVAATDWTTETLISQLRRNSINLNPRFQRRDAWNRGTKSRFIESLIMGLPVPQIVLAEAKSPQSGYLVLDGKQRLLSLLQFWGLGAGENNRFSLSGLQVLTNLKRMKFADLESEPDLQRYYNSLLNQTIRTVVIKNWPDSEFLHLVFLRLNTGSTKLSPQELRQALRPGPFSDWIDQNAAECAPLMRLLGNKGPDSRMRDTEVLARFIAFQYYIEEYKGRMAAFLDTSFEKLNAHWNDTTSPESKTAPLDLENYLNVFQSGLEALFTAFDGEPNNVARRPDSVLLNRTLLDMLLYYTRHQSVREVMASSPASLRAAYQRLFEDTTFREALDSDTASISNTVIRLQTWGRVLNDTFELNLTLPEAAQVDGKDRIVLSTPS